MQIKPFPKVENIHAVAIPFPAFSDLITANMYALGRGPVTLIDSGPKFPGSFEFVQREFKSAGIDLKNVERIILTHGHLDHFGLAQRLREAAVKPVESFIHVEDEWRVSGEKFLEAVWSEEMENLMAVVDVPQVEIEKIKERFSFFKELWEPLKEVSTFEEGDEFKGEGYHLKVIHTPGHTPGSCCLYEPRQKILFSGDNIIKHITPNPLLEIQRDRLLDPNYQSLKAFLNSLDKLNGLDTHFVFPGHGEYIEDLQGTISTYRMHHRQRMDLVWRALREKTRPLYYIIDDVFPYVPEDDVFLAISEILVHLEILINEGRVELADPGPPSLYRALD
jgi:glyoxylase-like metal-dependent hydrolase (beta-lactamase superfamily II)